MPTLFRFSDFNGPNRNHLLRQQHTHTYKSLAPKWVKTDFLIHRRHLVKQTTSSSSITIIIVTSGNNEVQTLRRPARYSIHRISQTKWIICICRRNNIIWFIIRNIPSKWVAVRSAIISMEIMAVRWMAVATNHVTMLLAIIAQKMPPADDSSMM